MGFKACRNCKYILKTGEKCPKCGSKNFSKFNGAVFILDPDKSEIAKIMDEKEKGIYAIKVD